MTKYGLINPVSVKHNIERLTNQLWKLIPMRENEEDWHKQLDTVSIEIAGMNELFLEDKNFVCIIFKLEGLKVTDTTFETYRRTVFECINLLQEFGRGLGV